MATRRRSLAPTANPPVLATAARASRRASTAVFVAPVLEEKRGRGRPGKPKPETRVSTARGRSKKTEATPKAITNDDSFVSGEAFDFVAMESPKGPLTRARRSSMFVGNKSKKVVKTPKTGLPRPVTSTRRRSKLDVVMETPDISKFSDSQSFLGNSEIIELIESPENEISFKVLTPVAKPPTPQEIVQTEIPMEIPIEEPVTSNVQTSEQKTSVRGRPAKTPVPKKISKVMAKKPDGLGIKITPSKVVISPIKKAALKKAYANQIINVKKTPEHTLKVPRKFNSPSATGFPGTPQPTDPANLLKRNLKKKVEVQFNEKVQEIPKNLSPYTLMQGETENGSPVDHFVKMNKKPSKENITGTPAPVKRSRILQRLDQNMAGSPDPYTTRRRTPRRIIQESKAESKTEKEVLITPKVEVENAAVNKAINKVEVPSPVKSTSQIITGDLVSMCSIM